MRRNARLSRRLPLVSAIFLTIASAFVLFGLKHDTRRLETQVLRQERGLERARHELALLEAERARLARPERIEALAHGLGLRPITPPQYRQSSATPQRTAEAQAPGR